MNLNLNNFTMCSVTGFLEAKKGTNEERTITPQQKTQFLKNFKGSGDATHSIERIGFKYNELEWHLKNDPVFKEEYRLTLLAMKHKIEGKMFREALVSDTTSDRVKWLQKNFPEDYNRTPKEEKKLNKPHIDKLLESL